MLNRTYSALFLGTFLAANTAFAAPSGTVDTFTAETASMTPSGVSLKIDIRDWSDDAGRAAVLDVLSKGSDVGPALKELPTLGYVWQSGSAVGYVVKYAYRETMGDKQRVTFVTERPIGSYSFKPWTANQSAGKALDYSVIELYLDAQGTGGGNLSLAADVELDPAKGLVSLAAPAGGPQLLTNAKIAPKPYWAKTP